MRIVFNLNQVGLANNGGCRTIIKCAETLSELGHEALLFTNVNKYTWHRIKVPVVKRFPKCDALIATGIKSCWDTLNRKAEVKLYYIRGFEKWMASKKDLIRSYEQLPCIVNSSWLQEYLLGYGVQSQVIYPGLDFEQFYLETPTSDRANIIGALFHSRHKTKRHKDAVSVAKKLGCKLVMLNKDVCNPNPDRLRKYYNSVKVWFSPSELEGLHNPPMEAALCGAVVVATDHYRSGTSDYVKNNNTALTYPARDINEACSKVRLLFEDEQTVIRLQKAMKEKLQTVIGDRKTNMTKLVKHIQSLRG